MPTIASYILSVLFPNVYDSMYSCPLNSFSEAQIWIYFKSNIYILHFKKY